MLVYDAEFVGVDECFDAECGIIKIVTEIPPYEGAVSVTPSNQTQVLLTAGTVVHDDIVVNPIPQNYGKIGWNGSILTVS